MTDKIGEKIEDILTVDSHKLSNNGYAGLFEAFIIGRHPQPRILYEHDGLEKDLTRKDAINFLRENLEDGDIDEQSIEETLGGLVEHAGESYKDNQALSEALFAGLFNEYKDSRYWGEEQFPRRKEELDFEIGKDAVWELFQDQGFSYSDDLGKEIDRLADFLNLDSRQLVASTKDEYFDHLTMNLDIYDEGSVNFSLNVEEVSDWGRKMGGLTFRRIEVPKHMRPETPSNYDYSWLDSVKSPTFFKESDPNMISDLQGIEIVSTLYPSNSDGEIKITDHYTSPRGYNQDEVFLSHREEIDGELMSNTEDILEEEANRRRSIEQVQAIFDDSVHQYPEMRFDLSVIGKVDFSETRMDGFYHTGYANELSFERADVGNLKLEGGKSRKVGLRGAEITNLYLDDSYNLEYITVDPETEIENFDHNVDWGQSDITIAVEDAEDELPEYLEDIPDDNINVYNY